MVLNCWTSGEHIVKKPADWLSKYGSTKLTQSFDDYLYTRCIGLFTVNKLKDALYTQSKLCIKQNQQSSFEQGFNIHAGSIQREYYLFFEISNNYAAFKRKSNS